MSKESLLKETTVRRFMKLAGTEVLASDFLIEGGKAGKMDRKDVANKASGRWLKEEEEDDASLESLDEQEEEGAPPPDLGAEEDLDVDLDAEPEGDAELGEPEPEPEEGELPEDDLDPETITRKFVDAIADVASGLGVDVEVGEEEAPELEVPEMEMGEEGEDLQLGGEETGELGPEEEDLGAEGPEETLQEINYIDEDVILNEVYARVTNRLMQEKRADDIASTLAKRISRRLKR
jgi:hypothetical protein